MCGIAGCADDRSTAAGLNDLAIGFTERLHHRGPDDRGVLVEPEVGLALAHTRLAILDTGPIAAQPMVDADDRHVLVYNGEVYNHEELRPALAAAGRTFRGTGDTETLLAAIATWGLDETLTRVHGMFALAVYDRHRRRLSLARDRFGQKPLYHGVVDGRLVFCSDLVALDALGPRPDIDRSALAAYFRTGSVPGDRSIHVGVEKVPPGHIVEYRHRSGEGPGSSRSGFGPGGWSRGRSRCWWSVEACAADALADPFDGSLSDAVGELDTILSRSVNRRMLADVPVGSLLSGGVDSSLITALMQASSSTPIETYTVAFPGHGIDESVGAAAVADHLGTRHDTLSVGADDLLAAVPALSATNGEPLADPSQLPTYLICRHARRRVTVALGGDGGDELFGGYPWYRLAPAAMRAVAGTPGPVRAGLAATGRLVGRRPGRLGRRASTLARVMAVDDPRDARFALTGAWKSGTVPVLAAGGLVESARDWPPLPEWEQQLMWLDSVAFLPDTVLTKVDRASMAASLEARAPLLDQDVARFAWTLPTAWRVGPPRSVPAVLNPFGARRGAPTNKLILRRLLERYVPPAITDRPKQGFELPIAAWLRSDLAPWAGDLLDPARIRADGYLDPVAIEGAWRKHLAGTEDNASRLWTVLMFQSWLDEQRGPDRNRVCRQAG